MTAAAAPIAEGMTNGCLFYEKGRICHVFMNAEDDKGYYGCAYYVPALPGQ